MLSLPISASVSSNPKQRLPYMKTTPTIVLTRLRLPPAAASGAFSGTIRSATGGSEQLAPRGDERLRGARRGPVLSSLLDVLTQLRKPRPVAEQGLDCCSQFRCYSGRFGRDGPLVDPHHQRANLLVEFGEGSVVGGHHRCAVGHRVRDHTRSGDALRVEVPLAVRHDDRANRLEERVLVRSVDGAEDADVVGQELPQPLDLFKTLATVYMSEEPDGVGTRLGWLDLRPASDQMWDVAGGRGWVGALYGASAGLGQREEHAVAVDRALERATDGPQGVVDAVVEQA